MNENNNNNIVPKYKSEINFDSIRDSIILQNLSEERRLPEALKYLGKYCIESLTPSKAYALDIVENLEKEFPLAHNFAFKIIQIYMCAAYSKTFFEKIQTGFYNAHIIPTLPYELLLEGEKDIDIKELEKQINENTLKLLEYSNYLEKNETEKYYRNYRAMTPLQRFFALKRMLKRSSDLCFGLLEGCVSGAMLGATIGSGTGFIWGGPSQFFGMLTGMLLGPTIAVYISLVDGKEATADLFKHYRETFGLRRSTNNAGI